jgi:hypothetical protein
LERSFGLDGLLEQDAGVAGEGADLTFASFLESRLAFSGARFEKVDKTVRELVCPFEELEKIACESREGRGWRDECERRDMCDLRMGRSNSAWFVDSWSGECDADAGKAR